MSFDEQPDGDPHGECAEQIRKLEDSVKTLESECNQLNNMSIKQRALIEDLASMCRRLSYSVKRSGNDKLAHQCVELLKKHDLGGSVIRTSDVPSYKYPETFCSQCGGEFGPGNEGFSHCENHKHLPRLG